jgi:hypothetical protein
VFVYRLVAQLLTHSNVEGADRELAGVGYFGLSGMALVIVATPFNRLTN